MRCAPIMTWLAEQSFLRLHGDQSQSPILPRASLSVSLRCEGRWHRRWKARVPCEFTGGRAANASERVGFIVEKVDKGLKVAVEGRPDTERIIPKAKLRVSINKSAYDYCDEVLGPREEVGNKGGSLSNRMRAESRK